MTTRNSFPEPKPISKGVLIELYVNQQHTTEEIASILHITQTTVLKYMRKHGLKSRDTNHERSLVYRLGLSEDQFAQVLQQLYIIEKVSINELGKKYDVSSQIISRYLDKYGIPKRDHKTANQLHNSATGNPKWRGGGTVHSDGYKLLYRPDHPHCDSRGYVYEHRMVMENNIGRFLSSEEHVHHINGNKADNRTDNLQLISNSEHARLHAIERKMTTYN